MSQPNCYFCGQFTSWKSFVSWVPFGLANDLEPPDECFACKRCGSEGMKMKGYVWQGPTWHHND